MTRLRRQRCAALCLVLSAALHLLILWLSDVLAPAPPGALAFRFSGLLDSGVLARIADLRGIGFQDGERFPELFQGRVDIDGEVQQGFQVMCSGNDILWKTRKAFRYFSTH